MKTTFAARLAFSAPLALVLAACGSATDASEDALADNVELPADESMAGTPAPVADEAALAEDAASAEDEATDAAAEAEAMVAADAPAAPATAAATPAAE